MINLNINKIILLISLLFGSNINAWELDKKVKLNESGIIGAHYDIPKYSLIAIVGVAAYEGSESRLGKTSWQALDAGIVSQMVSESVKRIAARNRPREAQSPNEWGEGGKSFPSGHVSGMTAMVTPYILEYKDDYPLVHLLWAFPVHQMVGRVSAQAHWQSDVIAGALLGVASGYWAHKRETPMLLYFSKDNIYVGLKYKF